MKKSTIFFAVLLLLLSGASVNAQNINLLPAPQNVTWGKDKFQIAGAKVLVSPDLLQREQNAIIQFIAFINQNTGLTVATTHSEDANARFIVLTTDKAGLAIPVPNEQSGDQSREAYRITVNTNKVLVSAKTDAGLFYALQTLRQLIVDKENNSYIPEVDIEDYPAFAYRGVMMDFSHGGLLTEQEIKNQIDFLSRWKMNQYYFYNEVSIEMKGYPLINYNACYSQEQIKRIIAYAKERHIDVIPFVNFYSHLHELLRLEKYSGLAIGKYGHDLDPDNIEVQTLLSDWIKQYVDIFPTPFIHVGFDESWETERLTAEDPSIKPKGLYLKQLNFVTKELQNYNKTVMVWTDISKNYPDILSEFPKKLIPVIWEYSDDPSKINKWIEPVKEEKMPFFVQSAVDSWGNVYPASNYTFDNIDICLKTSRDEKAIGYITSVWTDAVQPLLRNTWLFMAYGSIGAWQNTPLDRNDFINNYCQIIYPEIAKQMSNGFNKMAESEAFLAKTLGRHTLNKMFINPFSDVILQNTNTHIDNLKKARLAAEIAQENFIEALNYKTADTTFIKSMLLNSRMSHYTATRFIWAKTIVDRWNWTNALKADGHKDHTRRYDINNSTHGLTVDMMDWCTEINKEYKQAWLSEYMPYRMGTIAGRFDSEYLFWRRMYNKISDFHYLPTKNPLLRFEDIFLNE